MPTISLITIGNELLKGRIVNTNAARAGELLRRYGFNLSRVVVIEDGGAAIRQTVLAEMEAHDIVLICGGLGPTKDDITKHTLADIFQQPLVMHAPTLAFLEARYRDRKRSMTRLTRLQAMVPEGCEVIPNSKGTAPGMGFLKDGKRAYSMPGVPFEMLHMLEYEVIPRIQAAFPADIFQYKIVRVANIPESLAAERMETIEDTFDPAIDVAYLPRVDGLWLELSIRSSQEDQVQAAGYLTEAEAKVARLFEDVMYTRGEQSLAKEVADVCWEKGLTLAVAESLTGGQVAANIVSVSGVSRFFLGSVTAYSVDIKREVLGVPQDMIDAHTVVSEEVVKAMAEGVRRVFNADVGIATTGLAEPDGETKAQVWLGYADGKGSMAEHRFFLHGRNVNIARSANYLLQLCLKNVRERFV